MLRAYHYTWGKNFFAIIDEGVIVRSGDKSEAHLPRAARTPHAQRAAWFSLADEYEPTATPLWHDRNGTRGLTVAETIERCGIFRIAVDAADVPDDWCAYKRRARVPAKTSRGLEAAAAERNAPMHLWRVSWASVPSDRWLAVERYDVASGSWVPIDWRAWRAA